MYKKLAYYIILVILLIGIYGAGDLVLEEFKTGEGCPKIMSVPVCLIVLICFIIPLIVHLLKRWNALFFLFTGLAGSIALIASMMQFIEKGQCPKTDSGIPMCYYSLIMFSSLIVLKVISIKNKNNQKQII